ncbi:MAG TPA: hypothetical protein VGK16_04825 [Candidatus Limnocylindrales bacterium]|jgi:hypothetical protein
MIDGAFSAKPTARAHEPQRALDEWSMRVLELGLAGISLLAVVLLTVAR